MRLSDEKTSQLLHNAFSSHFDHDFQNLIADLHEHIALYKIMFNRVVGNKKVFNSRPCSSQFFNPRGRSSARPLRVVVRISSPISIYKWVLKLSFLSNNSIRVQKWKILQNENFSNLSCRSCLGCREKGSITSPTQTAQSIGWIHFWNPQLRCIQ